MQELGKRIIVIGCPGSGKSTLAARLGEMTGMPVINLDKEYWNPGWVETPEGEWRDKVSMLMAGGEWITDGNFPGTLDLRLERADTVIFLDFNRFVCLYSMIRRTFKNYGRTRPDMGEGCPDKVDWEFVGWIWNHNSKVRPGIMEKLAGFGGNVIVLKSRKHVNKFLWNCV